jgi:hypothetical protein
MKIRERILDFLLSCPGGIDDDALADALNLKQRQQANGRCRQLQDEGLVERRRVDGKIQNFFIGDPAQAVRVVSEDVHKEDMDKPWFWEGNVQSVVVKYLAVEGLVIRSVVDTESRQSGKDIEAAKEGTPVWITVKGYPKGTTRTRPATQARHWFSHAIFDVVKYRSESQQSYIGVALPDFVTYRNLAEKISWFKDVSRFTFYWVDEQGGVSVE